MHKENVLKLLKKDLKDHDWILESFKNIDKEKINLNIPLKKHYPKISFVHKM